MGISWVDEVPLDVQHSLPERAAALARQMRPDELCSLLQSMALMKVESGWWWSIVYPAVLLPHTPTNIHLLTLSTHSVNPPSQPTLSTHPLNPPYQPTLSTHPIYPPSQPTLSTHPIYPLIRCLEADLLLTHPLIHLINLF